MNSLIYNSILVIKIIIAIIILIVLYICFLKTIKEDRDNAKDLDYRNPVPNVARLKRINKRLGKS